MGVVSFECRAMLSLTLGCSESISLEMFGDLHFGGSTPLSLSGPLTVGLALVAV